MTTKCLEMFESSSCAKADSLSFEAERSKHMFFAVRVGDRSQWHAHKTDYGKNAGNFGKTIITGIAGPVCLCWILIYTVHGCCFGCYGSQTTCMDWFSSPQKTRTRCLFFGANLAEPVFANQPQ